MNINFLNFERLHSIIYVLEDDFVRIETDLNITMKT